MHLSLFSKNCSIPQRNRGITPLSIRSSSISNPLSTPLSTITESPGSNRSKIPDFLVSSLSDIQPGYNEDTNVTVIYLFIFYLLRLYSTSAEGLQDTRSYSLLKLFHSVRLQLKSCMCYDPYSYSRSLNFVVVLVAVVVQYVSL